jgi:predicted MPP superfamily phosphohydrolase
VTGALRLLGGAAALGAAGVAYAHVETKLFTVRHVTVPVLPPGQADLRVLHVSDLHVVPSQRTKLAWIRSLAELRPDLVVDTGDNLADVGAVGPLLDALEPLLATTPGVFVMGSNDYFGPRPKNPARYLRRDARVLHAEPIDLPWQDLARAFTAAGWKDLANRRDVVEAAGRTVACVGVDDPHLDRDAFPPAASDGAGPDGCAPDLRLGVAHAPYVRVLDAMHADGVDAVLAGHTHGGQLRVPFYGALVTNCDLDRGRVSGLHGWPGPRPDAPGGAGSTWLHVSAGAGTSPYAPVRFACRPEATLLTLIAR